MGASDGFVLGTTKVVDHGPDSARWNLVVIGDGYQASEIDTYHADVEGFLTNLRTATPLDELFCGINVYRIDVVSTDSGADDPGCDGFTPPTTAATFFDATYCSLYMGVPMDRLLTVDDVRVLEVATARVPLQHQVICIVNSAKYGGSGGAIATCASGSPEVALHEIGHSAFGLGDEYDGSGAYAGGEPAKPNLTIDTNRATIKWGAFIDLATPLPSSCHGGCGAGVSTCVPPGAPPPAGVVGAFEGGRGNDCNIYRPVDICRMSQNSVEYCPVCADVIRTALTPFQPAETIDLVTPSLEFLHVPAGMGGIGVTTHRAVRFDVVTCRTLTFIVTVDPTAPFTLVTTDPVPVTADPIVPAAAALIWVAYTSTNPGDSATGTMTVQCVETGDDWVIDLSADTVSRPRTAVSLVIDRSFSLSEDAGDATTKVQKVREAADVFISTMLPDDGIGLVRFNQAADRIMEIEVAGAAPGDAGRDAAIGHINGSEIDPAGSTSIGDGVVKGKQMLDDAMADPASDYQGTAMVVLTDGMWNMPPSLADVSGDITATTFAVGLGLPSNISVPALTTLTGGHDGYLLITGAITTDQSMRLSKYFLQILAGVTNAEIASDPGGVLNSTSEHRIPFRICEADYGMDLIVLSPAPYLIDFQLEAPDGTRITPSSGGAGANSQFVLSRYASYYRCALPVLPADPSGSHEGLWHAVLKLAEKPGVSVGKQTNPFRNGQVPYEFVAHTYSALKLSANIFQKSFEVGGVAEISASLFEYDAVLKGRAKVWAEIRSPLGATDIISLTEHGPGDSLTASYPIARPGVYNVRLRARGETMLGTPFEREQTFTAVASPGADHWHPNDPNLNRPCGFVYCLREMFLKNKGCLILAIFLVVLLIILMIAMIVYFLRT